jgi:hypothetical protein
LLGGIKPVTKQLSKQPEGLQDMTFRGLAEALLIALLLQPKVELLATEIAPYLLHPPERFFYLCFLTAIS